MGSHNENKDIFNFYAALNGIVEDPGVGGTFNLQGTWGARCTIASSTRKLPDNMPVGVKFYVIATGSVTITNAAGTTVTTLQADQVGEFLCTGSTSWVGVVHAIGASNNTPNLYTTLTTVQAQIPVPLATLREVSSGAVGNIVANGGLLASDTTPTLTPTDGATDPTQLVTWASSNNDVVMFQFPMPTDIAPASTFTINAEVASGGTTNAVGFACTLAISGGYELATGNTTTNQTTTFTTVTRSLTPETLVGVKTGTILLAPLAHTTDTLVLRSLWVTYTKALLSV